MVWKAEFWTRLPTGPPTYNLASYQVLSNEWWLINLIGRSVPSCWIQNLVLNQANVSMMTLPRLHDYASIKQSTTTQYCYVNVIIYFDISLRVRSTKIIQHTSFINLLIIHVMLKNMILMFYILSKGHNVHFPFSYVSPDDLQPQNYEISTFELKSVIMTYMQ